MNFNEKLQYYACMVGGFICLILGAAFLVRGIYEGIIYYLR